MADVILNIPVNGKGPVDVMMQDPPAGAYEVEIMEASEHRKGGQADGSVSIEINVAIVEAGSPAVGMATRIYLGTDWSKAFNIGHFVNLFTGILQKAGKSAEDIKAKLAQPLIQIPISSFVGKRAFIIVKAAPDELDAQGRPKLADKNFMTMVQYEQAKKTIAAVGAPAAKRSNGAQPGAAQTVGGPAPVVTGTTPPAPSTGAIPPAPSATGTPVIGDLFT
jgi:hypothetical protein